MTSGGQAVVARGALPSPETSPPSGAGWRRLLRQFPARRERVATLLVCAVAALLQVGNFTWQLPAKPGDYWVTSQARGDCNNGARGAVRVPQGRERCSRKERAALRRRCCGAVLATRPPTISTPTPAPVACSVPRHVCAS